jgi:tryptophan 2,3-dioxygenase
MALEPNGTSIVRWLLVFPQTPCHDEVAFLRSILLAECLYWGTLLFVQRALCAIHLGERRVALALLRAGTRFAAPLIHVFHVVRIMPPAHFLGFREATGDASAVQSRSWQLLDVHMYGVLAEKVPVLGRVPEVRDVLRFANPTFVPLVRVIERLDGTGVDAELCTTIGELDRKLRAWRKFHERQLAGRQDPAYLPEQAPGTGGTLGYAYLASHRPPRASQIAAERGASFDATLDGTSR